MDSLAEQGLRLAHYGALLFLFGWTAFRLLKLRHLEWVSQNEGRAALTLVAVSAPLLSIALMLVSIAAMMGAPIASLDWPMIEAMIIGTEMGMAFLIRLALLIVGLCALMTSRAGRLTSLIAALCFASALLTLSWSGHAAATEGGLGLFHRLNNAVHLLATSLWLGAICWFLFLTLKAHRQRDLIPALPLLRVMHGFAPLGVGLVAAAALTGVINAQLIFRLENIVAVLTTPYGILLIAKVLLVGMMLTFGAHNAWIGRREVLDQRRETAEPNNALSRLRRSLAGELLLAGGAIGLVAVLGTMSPMMM
ncbi:MAG: copper homeostasis membrane protein CopD [Erythrobacter sp.]